MALRRRLFARRFNGSAPFLDWLRKKDDKIKARRWHSIRCPVEGSRTAGDVDDA